MKFLVLAACVAVSSAQGFFGLQAHPNGAVTPIDEPAVAAARADHLATKFGATGYATGYPYAGAGYAAGYPYAAGYAANNYYGYAAAYPYAGPQHFPSLIAHPNGAVVPVDEPAVAAARADHFAAQNEAAALAGPAYAAVAPAVAYAAAPAVAYAAAPAVAYNNYQAYAGPLHFPSLVAHPNGAVVPADEPAVVAARAEHLAAKGVYGGVYATAPVAPAAYAAGYGAGYAGLVAHPNGAVVPVDEPAVAAARAEHLAAHGY